MLSEIKRRKKNKKKTQQNQTLKIFILQWWNIFDIFKAKILDSKFSEWKANILIFSISWTFWSPFFFSQYQGIEKKLEEGFVSEDYKLRFWKSFCSREAVMGSVTEKGVT